MLTLNPSAAPLLVLLLCLVGPSALAAPQSQPLEQPLEQQPAQQAQPASQQQQQQQQQQALPAGQEQAFLVAPANPLPSGRAADPPSPTATTTPATTTPATTTTTTTSISTSTTPKALSPAPGATTPAPAGVSSSSAPAGSSTTPASTTQPPYTRVPQLDENFEILDYDKELVELNVLAQAEAEKLFEIAHHHNNDEVHAFLQKLATAYPEVTRLYSIGESVEKRKLWVLLITEEPERHVPLKPDFRYIANMHGNEVVGREMVLQLARLILENYAAARGKSSDPSSQPSGQKFIRKLVKGTRIHLMPTMNPDGYARSAVSCVYEEPSRRGRVNANGVDLNRNFPDEALNTHLDAGTQPEVRAVIEWSRRTPFVLSANLHGGALLANFPYDSSTDLNTKRDAQRRAPDHSLLKSLALIYSYAHPTMWNGQMCYDQCTEYHEETFEQGVTTGANWFTVHGGMQDWMYNNTNDFHITLELGCNQYPAAEFLPDYWEKNRRAMLNYMRQVHRGIKGIVVDERSNKPLENVTIFVSKVDPLDSLKVEPIQHNVTSNKHGEYFRLLERGQYHVQFVHPHYQIERAHLQPGDGMAQVHNIRLKPLDGAAGLTDLAGSLIPGPAGQLMSELAHKVDNNDDHSLVVATLVMSVIILLLLLSMAAAFVIQRQRYRRSQSVSVELQPTRSTSTGTAA